MRFSSTPEPHAFAYQFHFSHGHIFRTVAPIIEDAFELARVCKVFFDLFTNGIKLGDHGFRERFFKVAVSLPFKFGFDIFDA